MDGLLKSSKAAGVAAKSFTSTLIDVPSLTEEEDHAIKWSAASFYGGMVFQPSFPLVVHCCSFIPGGADTVSSCQLFQQLSMSTTPLERFGHERVLLGYDPLSRSSGESSSRD